jgi:hypothetical protein
MQANAYGILIMFRDAAFFCAYYASKIPEMVNAPED